MLVCLGCALALSRGPPRSCPSTGLLRPSAFVCDTTLQWTEDNMTIPVRGASGASDGVHIMTGVFVCVCVFVCVQLCMCTCHAACR